MISDNRSKMDRVCIVAALRFQNIQCGTGKEVAVHLMKELHDRRISHYSTLTWDESSSSLYVPFRAVRVVDVV